MKGEECAGIGWRTLIDYCLSKGNFTNKTQTNSWMYEAKTGKRTISCKNICASRLFLLYLQQFLIYSRKYINLSYEDRRF